MIDRPLVVTVHGAKDGNALVVACCIECQEIVVIGSKSTEDLIAQGPLKNLYFFDITQPANERYITEKQEQVMNLLEMTRKLIKKTGLGSLFYGLARPFANRGTLPDSATARTTLNDWSPDPDKSCFIANSHYEPKYDLSIIIPAFNVEKYITDCLMSVFSQQLADYRIEVIVVNDGSTDRTPQLLDSLAREHPITVIHQANRGFSGARNSGLNRASGQYVMFLDSDDFLLPDSIYLLLTKARQTGADIVEGGSFSFSDGNQRHQYRTYAEADTVAASSLRGHPWGKIIRSDFFHSLRFPENYWFEDSIFTYVIYPLARKAATVAAVVYAYRQNPTSITRTAARKPKCVDTYWIVERLMKDLPRFSIQPNQTLYEQVLRQIDLNYQRTRRMPAMIKQAIFGLSANLLDDYFPGYTTISSGKYRKIEQALRNRHYGQYRLIGEWLK